MARILVAISLLFAVGPAAAQQPSDTTVCDLAKSPDSFDGKLVRVSAYVTLAFEDFTLHDLHCPEEAPVNWRSTGSLPPEIWVEYADADYSIVKAHYAPIVDDTNLSEFRRIVAERSREGQMAAATLVGTFFAGKPVVINGKATGLRGFGHMGCCSLFVLSRVEFVTKDYDPSIDYSWPEWNVGVPEGCYSEQMVGVPKNATLRQWQEQANAGDSSYADPKKVAEKELDEILHGNFGRVSGGRTELIQPKKSDLSPADEPGPTETLIAADIKPYLKRFTWLAADHQNRIVIAVARPYWLLAYVKSPNDVIWTPSGASVVSCVAKKSKSKKH